MSVIDLNRYKEQKAEQNDFLEDVDLDAELSRALDIDEPENKLQERYGETELDKLRAGVRSMRIPTNEDFEKRFGKYKREGKTSLCFALYGFCDIYVLVKNIIDDRKQLHYRSIACLTAATID